MRRDSLAFAISGTAFGLLVGWIIGTQYAAPRQVAAPAVASAPASSPAAPAPPPLDQARVRQLEQQVEAEPRNVDVRVELAGLYFDAARLDEAAPWYEAALAIDPRHVGANADLAIVYFYQGQMDRALAQIDRALAVEPNHVKALLNQGIIRWRGKQDIVGAEQSWERVIELAPDSEEARFARQGLDGLRAAHQGSGAQP